MRRPCSCSSPNQLPRGAVLPAPSGAGVRRGGRALPRLVVVVERRGGAACAGKDPDAAPLPRSGGRVTDARQAAVAPGRCSLAGAGLRAARRPRPFLKENAQKTSFLAQTRPERRPGIANAALGPAGAGRGRGELLRSRFKGRRRGLPQRSPRAAPARRRKNSRKQA